MHPKITYIKQKLNKDAFSQEIQGRQQKKLKHDLEDIRKQAGTKQP